MRRRKPLKRTTPLRAKRTRTVAVRVTPEELAAWEKEANEAGRAVSSWLRWIANKWTGDALLDVVAREVEKIDRRREKERRA